MPTHRSITLSLISHYDLRSIPEYTLPPSTSIGISGSSSMIHGDTEKKAYSLAGGSTDSINVYAPTFPNSQFLLKFNAAKPTFPAEYYFFKFFVDGKHFSSWGIGEESDWSGKMVFGLFVNKYDQIERRTLTFGSAANVSSSIEVKVFRCFGRKRDNAHLDCLTEDEGERQKKPTHRENHAAIAQDELVGLLKGREQDMRGVRFTHGGILRTQYHQSLRYYKYELIDPVTHPFATFRYFFRSWSQLEALQVIAPLGSGSTEPESAVHGSNSPHHRGSESRGPIPLQNTFSNKATPQTDTGRLSGLSIGDERMSIGIAISTPLIVPPPRALPPSIGAAASFPRQCTSSSGRQDPTPLWNNFSYKMTPRSTTGRLPKPSIWDETGDIGIAISTPPVFSPPRGLLPSIGAAASFPKQYTSRNGPPDPTPLWNNFSYKMTPRSTTGRPPKLPIWNETGDIRIAISTPSPAFPPPRSPLPSIGDPLDHLTTLPPTNPEEGLLYPTKIPSPSKDRLRLLRAAIGKAKLRFPKGTFRPGHRHKPTNPPTSY